MRLSYFLFTGFIFLTAMPKQTCAASNTTKEQVAKEEARFSNFRKSAYKTTDENSKLEEQEKERQSIELSNALNKAHLERELADIQADITRLMMEREKAMLKWDIECEKKEREHKSEIMTLNLQKEKLEAEINIAECKLDQEELKFRAIIAKLEHRIKFLQAGINQAEAEKAKYEAERQRADYIDVAPVYLTEPLQAGKSLIISDRRIELNGCITPWKANYVTDRIQYFNNKDASNPIFIIIGSSPGGSVRAGADILKAMENSRAPVYVVVKGFAASMAALITTLADKSYAYPNAIILHHQPWNFTCGNVRKLKEQQEFLQAWWHRLGGRVAKKMGISLEKLDQLLYEKSASGDWLEFADCAQKLKWVDYTINGIQETGIRELPEPNSYTWKHYYEDSLGTTSAIDNNVIYLPPLEAKDFYYLYNPDSLYQTRFASHQ